VFKYSNTSAETMSIAGKLMEKGIPFTNIIDNTFYAKTYVQNQVLGRALLESVVFYDGKCIFSVVKRDEFELYNITSKDLDGIVEQLRITKGVECAIFLYEVGELEYKVSLRSNEIVDVSTIATYFGGGGHIRAAGFNMKGNVYDVINNISEQIELQLG
jgi:phosphoesterase RecJ-like protein